MESLLPYYGMSLPLLKTRREEAEGIAETFTLIVHDGKVELQWNDNYSRDRWWASRPRADAQINLMEPFIGLLPSFRATFSIHDQPSILLDYKRQDALVNAALAHKGESPRLSPKLYVADMYFQSSLDLRRLIALSRTGKLHARPPLPSTVEWRSPRRPTRSFPATSTP